MLGSHCIKTWSTTQQAIALSSAEAELYATVEGATRARGLIGLAHELGFTGLNERFRLWTDNSSAKSFLCMHGVGRMRLLGLRDLWIKKEIAEGCIDLHKVLGTANPADLMTKDLHIKDIIPALQRMNLKAYTNHRMPNFST